MRRISPAILVAVAAIGASSSRGASPGEPLDLAALLAQAEASNPVIRAAVSREEALRHVPSQVEALPDPTASVSYTNESLTGFTLGSSEMSNLNFSWTQDLPYPGKRGLAGDVARAEIEVGSRAVEAVRLRVRVGVKSAYADLLRVDRTSAILTESRKLLETLRDAASARYESGEGILENVLKAQTELTRIDSALAGLAQERRSAAAAMRALLGSSEDAPLGPALTLPVGRTPDTESVEKEALDRSPELAALRAAVLRDESRVSLAKRSLRPDFLWGVAYSDRGSLDPMVTGMFGIKLPLYRNRKQKEAVAQSEYDLQATERDLDGRNVTILAEVRDLVARADRASEQMRLIREGTLPLARSTLDSAAAAYSTGRAEFVTLIEDFRALLDYERELEMQHAEKIKALAALESLTGAEYVMPGGMAGAKGVEHE